MHRMPCSKGVTGLLISQNEARMRGTNTSENRSNVQENPLVVRDARELVLHACFQRDPNVAPRGKRILLQPNVIMVEKASQPVKWASTMKKAAARLHLYRLAIRTLLL